MITHRLCSKIFLSIFLLLILFAKILTLILECHPLCLLLLASPHPRVFFLASSSCSSLAARREASVHAKRTYRIERVDTLRASSMWMACARFSRRFTDLFLMLRMQCEIKSAAKHRCKIELFLNEIYFVTIVEAMV